MESRRKDNKFTYFFIFIIACGCLLFFYGVKSMYNGSNYDDSDFRYSYYEYGRDIFSRGIKSYDTNDNKHHNNIWNDDVNSDGGYDWEYLWNLDNNNKDSNYYSRQNRGWRNGFNDNKNNHYNHDNRHDERNHHSDNYRAQQGHLDMNEKMGFRLQNNNGGDVQFDKRLFHMGGNKDEKNGYNNMIEKSYDNYDKNPYYNNNGKKKGSGNNKKRDIRTSGGDNYCRDGEFYGNWEYLNIIGMYSTGTKQLFELMNNNCYGLTQMHKSYKKIYNHAMPDKYGKKHGGNPWPLDDIDLNDPYIIRKLETKFGERNGMLKVEYISELDGKSMQPNRNNFGGGYNDNDNYENGYYDEWGRYTRHKRRRKDYDDEASIELVKEWLLQHKKTQMQHKSNLNNHRTYPVENYFVKTLLNGYIGTHNMNPTKWDIDFIMEKLNSRGEFSRSLHVIVIKDPLTWFKSICEDSYQIEFKHYINKNNKWQFGYTGSGGRNPRAAYHCPGNLSSLLTDIIGSDGKAFIGDWNELAENDFIFGWLKENNHGLVEYFSSLYWHGMYWTDIVSFWNDYYNSWGSEYNSNYNSDTNKKTKIATTTSILSPKRGNPKRSVGIALENIEKLNMIFGDSNANNGNNENGNSMNIDGGKRKTHIKHSERMKMREEHNKNKNKNNNNKDLNITQQRILYHWLNDKEEARLDDDGYREKMYTLTNNEIFDMKKFGHTKTERADIPVIIVRSEDVLFEPIKLVNFLCNCVGGIQRKHIYVPNKRIRGVKTRVQTMQQYSDPKYRYKQYTQKDIQFLRQNLNPNLIKRFGYTLQ